MYRQLTILNTRSLTIIVLFNSLFSTRALFPWSLLFEEFNDGKYLIISKQCHVVSWTVNYMIHKSHFLQTLTLTFLN